MSIVWPRRGLDPLLAAAGVIGPVLFAAGFLVQPWFRRGEYNATIEAISDLEAGPGGWVQQVNFVVFGLLTVALAVGLHRTLRPSGGSVLGPVILAGNGLGLVIAGVFPMRQDPGGGTYDPMGVHTVNGALFFLTIGIGLIVVSRQLAADRGWRDLAGYALGSGIATLVLFVPLSVLARPAGAVWHPWFGLAQRSVLAVWLLCLVVLAVRLWRLAGRTGP